METVPVHKLADIFVASFEISFEEQLSMLDSVDLKVRLSKATELVDRHLQVNHNLLIVYMLFKSIWFDASFSFCLVKLTYLWQSIRVAEKITQKVEGQLSKSQKEFLLRQQVGFLRSIISITSINTWNWKD